MPPKYLDVKINTDVQSSGKVSRRQDKKLNSEHVRTDASPSIVVKHIRITCELRLRGANLGEALADEGCARGAVDERLGVEQGLVRAVRNVGGCSA
jgi:hypothetical protein